MSVYLEGLSVGALEERLAAAGVSPAHARTVFARVQRGPGVADAPDGAALPPPVRRWLARPGAPQPVPVREVAATPSADGYTRKYLLAVGRDGARVEAVRMGFPGRLTACLSSQVGCALGCVFCATGRMGFVRNLGPGEIVAQAHHIERGIRAEGGPGLRNIVMMGMGEPMRNFDAVLEALDRLTDDRGLGLAQHRVSISTVGDIPGIRRLARHQARYSLAVSLHGASDEERGRLVPVNRKWPLADLLEACREYTRVKRARVFFAWTLIGGVNDDDAHARRLAGLLRGMDAHVNLIPLNATEGYAARAPDPERTRAFQAILRDAGLPATVRQRRGIDVDAGCGQLTVRGSKHAAPAGV